MPEPDAELPSRARDATARAEVDRKPEETNDQKETVFIILGSRDGFTFATLGQLEGVCWR
jgi:hypothetical protein